MDCLYDYEFRDFAPRPGSGRETGGFPQAGTTKFLANQDCWDWCTYYIDPLGMPIKGVSVSGVLETAGVDAGNGGGAGVGRMNNKNMCSVRKKLKNGGQMYCAYIMGKYSSYGLGAKGDHPYPGRCTMFVSSSNITVTGPFV